MFYLSEKMTPWKQRSTEKVPTMEFISTGIRLHQKIGNLLLFAQFQLGHIGFVPLKNF